MNEVVWREECHPTGTVDTTEGVSQRHHAAVILQWLLQNGVDLFGQLLVVRLSRTVCVSMSQAGLVINSILIWWQSRISRKSAEPSYSDENLSFKLRDAVSRPSYDIEESCF